MNHDSRLEIQHAFNKVQSYLREQGYQGPEYTQGSPISLITGIALHARFTTTTTTDIQKDAEVVRHNLQYAKLGFHTIQGEGFISILHCGN